MKKKKRERVFAFNVTCTNTYHITLQSFWNCFFTFRLFCFLLPSFKYTNTFTLLSSIFFISVFVLFLLLLQSLPAYISPLLKKKKRGNNNGYGYGSDRFLLFLICLSSFFSFSWLQSFHGFYYPSHLHVSFSLHFLILSLFPGFNFEQRAWSTLDSIKNNLCMFLSNSWSFISFCD